MKRNFLLSKHFILIISILLYLLLVLFFYYQTRDYAIEKSTQKIEEVLLNTQALRKYVTVQKNEIYRLQNLGYVDKEYFSPVLLSSTFISKSVNNVYNALRNEKGQEPITIRFAATNPRNLNNQASHKEELLLDKFNKNELEKYKELIQTDRGEAIYYAVATRITTKQCSVCHSDPKLAPKQLVQMYGDENGFYEHNGNIRALLSTVYPISSDLKDAQNFFLILSGASLIVFGFVIALTYKYINIIDTKQEALEDINLNLEDKVTQQTQEIRSQHEYLNLILNASSNIVIVSNLERIIYANNPFKEFNPYSTIDEFNKHYDFKNYIYKHFCDDESCNLETLEEILNKSQWLKTFLNNTKKLCFIIEEKMHYFTFSTNEIYHYDKKVYVHILSDVTELEKTKLKLEKLTVKDDLTKLHNRRYFNQIYTNELKRAQRENLYFTFAIFDIDYFKNYNDSLGHHMGDNALVEVANGIKIHFSRANDYSFRMGGEEFCVLTASKTLEGIKTHFTNFHKNIENLHIKHPDSSVSQYLTVSMGVFSHKVDSLNEFDFYKEADMLLYKAKEKRNSIVFNF